MIIFPAIDLKDGKAVRLVKGEFDKVDVFSENPEEMGTKFQQAGAQFIHIVDLDGAKDGSQKNLEVIKKIRSNVNIPVQVGGGIRNEETVKRLLDAGVDRVILGTAAVENPELLQDLINKYGDKIAVSVDAKDGKVATKGWVEKTNVDSVEFCKELEKKGLKTLIYTDISKDGMMQGTNREIYKILSDNCKNLDIIASGGVSNKEDIEILTAMDCYGAIVGKAIYLGALNLEEIIAMAKK